MEHYSHFITLSGFWQQILQTSSQHHQNRDPPEYAHSNTVTQLYKLLSNVGLTTVEGNQGNHGNQGALTKQGLQTIKPSTSWSDVKDVEEQCSKLLNWLSIQSLQEVMYQSYGLPNTMSPYTSSADSINGISRKDTVQSQQYLRSLIQHVSAIYLLLLCMCVELKIVIKHSLCWCMPQVGELVQEMKRIQHLSTETATLITSLEDGFYQVKQRKELYAQQAEDMTLQAEQNALLAEEFRTKAR